MIEAAGALGVISVSGCLGDSDDGTETRNISDSEDDATDAENDTSTSEGNVDTDSEASQWFNAPLENVLTDESFQLTDFDRPVLVHLFAIWCSKCDRQEREVDQLRSETDEFAMVSLNVDPNEDAAAVREHAESNGYDWQWATPPADVTERFVDEFGTSVTHAPNVPMILLCPDGSYRRLNDGVKSPETLQSELDSC